MNQSTYVDKITVISSILLVLPCTLKIEHSQCGVSAGDGGKFLTGFLTFFATWQIIVRLVRVTHYAYELVIITNGPVTMP